MTTQKAAAREIVIVTESCRLASLNLADCCLFYYSLILLKWSAFEVEKTKQNSNTISRDSFFLYTQFFIKPVNFWLPT